MSAVYPFFSATPFRCMSKHLFDCLSTDEQDEMRAAQRLERSAPGPAHSEEYKSIKNRLTALATERYQQYLDLGYALLKQYEISGKELFSPKDKDRLAFLLAKEAATTTLSSSEQIIKTALLYKAYYMFCGFNLANFCVRQRSNPAPIYLPSEIDREYLLILLGKQYLQVPFSTEESQLAAQTIYKQAMAHYQLSEIEKKPSPAKTPTIFQPPQQKPIIHSDLIIESYVPNTIK